MKVTLNIESCRECPHSSNNQQEHSDPFISHPTNTYWYCNQGGNITRNTVNIKDSYEISEDCPLENKTRG